jgi:hypothetical protein
MFPCPISLAIFAWEEKTGGLSERLDSKNIHNKARHYFSKENRNIFGAVRFRDQHRIPGLTLMTWTIVILAVAILIAISAVRPAR